MDDVEFDIFFQNLGALAARASVNEAVLIALVTSHPAPETVLACWNEHLTDVADFGFEGALPSFSDTLQEQLAHWSQVISAAVALRNGPA